MASTIRSTWILSIDPGEAYGFALFRRGELRFVTAADHTLGAVANTVKWAREQVGADTLAMVVENQYTGRGGKFNPKALDALIKRRCTWEVVAELNGVPWARVFPSSWQTILKSVPKDPGKKGRQTKERARTLALRRWPSQRETFEASGDACDAALIGLWYSNKQVKEHPELR